MPIRAILLFVLYQSGFGLVAAILARKKNRSMLLGFLLGASLGLIGIAIVSFFPPKVVYNKALDGIGDGRLYSRVAAGVRCPNCGMDNRLEADTCWYCQQPLREPEPVAVEASEDLQETRYLSNEEYNHLTPRQRAAVDDYSYLLSPEDADTLAAMRARFQYTEIILFLRDHGTKVTRY